MGADLIGGIADANVKIRQVCFDKVADHDVQFVLLGAGSTDWLDYRND